MFVVPMETIRDNAEYEIESLTQALGSGVTDDERVEILNGLSLLYRRAGIAAAMAAADADVFRADLRRSAECRRELLEIAQGKPVRPWYTRASHADPFFDGLAAGADEVALGIARLSRRDWLTDEEYEEDFLYATFLYVLKSGGPEAVELATILERYKRVLQGGLEPRLAVLESFLTRDEAEWQDSMTALLDARDAAMVAQEEAMTTDFPKAKTERAVFVEALGLLRIASTLSLGTDFDHVSLPTICR